MTSMKSSVSLALLSFILLGCSCVKKSIHSANDNQIQNDINALHREFKSLADEKVYFSFDSIKLSKEAKCTLILQANWLNSKQNVVANIEGHCDEIGTEAYNLRLGLKRAKSVRDFLVEHGVEASRLSVISYGKSRPEDSRNIKAAHKVNRRAVTVVIKNNISN